MASKSGGNKKESSQSDKNYWARAKLAGFASTHSARRIARHKKRMAKKAAHRARWEAKRRTTPALAA